jgi:predicted nucleic acid-binding protein
MGEPHLTDTNILLRFVKPDDRDHPLVRGAVMRLWTSGATLCYTSQNLGEFWNTCTRPVESNGYGMTIAEADRRAGLIEARFTLLHDGELVHREWRSLLVAHAVRGVQVHDAHLVAAMRVHGVRHILTFNVRDFKRYSEIVAVHPEEIAGGR